VLSAKGFVFLSFFQKTWGKTSMNFALKYRRERMSVESLEKGRRRHGPV
jgi:hypothetical protein